MKNLLLIFALLFVVLFASCGENSGKQENKEVQEIEDTDTEPGHDDKEPGLILFFGTSLTAGMGLDPDQAYPAVIQEKIDSLDLSYEVANAGLSGETTSAGKNRIDWILTQEVEVFVLELGANDGLRGIPLEEMRLNLQEIIDRVREKSPEAEILLAGMQIPPNMGQDYATGFREIFPELAEKNDLHLIPFLLKDVAGEESLNQRDRIHPTAEGQRILAENVWDVLQPVLNDPVP